MQVTSFISLTHLIHCNYNFFLHAAVKHNVQSYRVASLGRGSVLLNVRHNYSGLKQEQSGKKSDGIGIHEVNSHSRAIKGEDILNVLDLMC